MSAIAAGRPNKRGVATRFPVYDRLLSSFRQKIFSHQLTVDCRPAGSLTAELSAAESTNRDYRQATRLFHVLVARHSGTLLWSLEQDDLVLSQEKRRRCGWAVNIGELRDVRLLSISNITNNRICVTKLPV